MKQILRCVLGFHGAGPTPRATVMLWLPDQGWYPACDDCKRVMDKDAAKDGERIISTRIHHPTGERPTANRKEFATDKANVNLVVVETTKGWQTTVRRSGAILFRTFETSMESAVQKGELYLRSRGVDLIVPETAG